MAPSGDVAVGLVRGGAVDDDGGGADGDGRRWPDGGVDLENDCDGRAGSATNDCAAQQQRRDVGVDGWTVVVVVDGLLMMSLWSSTRHHRRRRSRELSDVRSVSVTSNYRHRRRRESRGGDGDDCGDGGGVDGGEN